jgi:hypothetical protein
MPRLSLEFVKLSDQALTPRTAGCVEEAVQSRCDYTWNWTLLDGSGPANRSSVGKSTFRWQVDVPLQFEVLSARRLLRKR